MTDRPPISANSNGSQLAGVIISIVILVLLVGILMPGITQHRGRGGRSESSNRLKQIALALHNYAGAFDGKLPPLTDVGEHAPHNAGLNSLFFAILPYLGEDRIFNVFYSEKTAHYANLDSTDGETPRGAAGYVIKAFLDPADKTAEGGTAAPVSVELPWTPPKPFTRNFTGTYATTSFAANGLVFGSNNASLPGTFKDGTSNTLLIAQRPQVCVPLNGAAPVYNLWGFGYYGPQTPAFALLTPDQPARMPSTGQASPQLPLSSDWTSSEIPVRIGHASAPSEIPNSDRPFVQIINGKPCDPRLLGTPHASGILIALADASVRSISPTISAWTFRAACTPDGDETLYSDWFQ